MALLGLAEIRKVCVLATTRPGRVVAKTRTLRIYWWRVGGKTWHLRIAGLGWATRGPPRIFQQPDIQACSQKPPLILAARADSRISASSDTRMTTSAGVKTRTFPLSISCYKTNPVVSYVKCKRKCGAPVQRTKPGIFRVHSTFYQCYQTWNKPKVQQYSSIWLYCSNEAVSENNLDFNYTRY